MTRVSRRDFLTLLTGGGLCAFLPNPAISQTSRRPNIIVILADDLGYGDLSCYGNQTIHTPNLDSLAAGGIRFTDFHSSCPVCSPTRAGLMTGRYQQRCGIPMVITAAKLRNHGLAIEETTFAERLKTAGYRTGVFGKWHLGYLPKYNPDKHGFDRFRGYVSGNVDYFSHIDQAGFADWWENSELKPEEGYSTHLITRHAVNFIEQNKDRPFCLYVAHEAPHYPYQGPDDKPERTAGGKFDNHGSRKDDPLAYKEMVETMDKGVGEIADKVKKLGLEEDTFIFFFSDNGATERGSNGSLHGYKGSLWEGGHRVPAMAYWPGTIAPGQLCDETAISLDIFPTVLDIGKTGVLGGLELDGVNLLPLLTKNIPLGERTLFWAYNKQKAVRQGPWKLLVAQQQNGKEKTALFHLGDDLGETKNLVEEEPERAYSLRSLLSAWEQDVNSNQ